jgi:hypothetical protein
LAADEIGSQLDSPRAKHRRGTQALLEHLSTFEGKTWQERWQDSRLDSGGHPVHELGDDKYRGYNLTHGLKALLCLRVIRPSVSGFRGNKFNQFPYAFQQSQGDPLLDKFFEATARSRASQKHQYRPLFDVCCALTTQGIMLADLTPQALLDSRHTNHRGISLTRGRLDRHRTNRGGDPGGPIVYARLANGRRCLSHCSVLEPEDRRYFRVPPLPPAGTSPAA